MAEVVEALLRVNFVAGLAILAVLALRAPVRRRFGPEIAYRLWIAPPFAAIATVTPLKVAHGPMRPLLHFAPAHFSPALVIAWLVGIAAAVLLMWRAQAAFLKAVRAGRAGPAMVGVISPRLVMPPNDGRYTDEERTLIRAHEREHILREDPRAGALIAAFQCLAWFNPLVHLAAHVARLDQELACDAAVMRRHPQSRTLYAKTLLKTQLADAALPLGCHWPARGRHPLEVRVALLARPAADASLAGPILILTASLTAAALAWAAEPPTPFTPPPPVNVVDGPDNGHMSVMLVSWPARAKT
jgi:beta-lactamase regulating signal transducer with metallopeptidase domain